jgi:hypothetical protein
MTRSSYSEKYDPHIEKNANLLSVRKNISSDRLFSWNNVLGAMPE